MLAIDDNVGENNNEISYLNLLQSPSLDWIDTLNYWDTPKTSISTSMNSGNGIYNDSLVNTLIVNITPTLKGYKSAESMFEWLSGIYIDVHSINTTINKQYRAAVVVTLSQEMTIHLSQLLQ